MAPATGLRLLHIAAVLVMMASSGGELAEEMLFPFDQIVSTFAVLRERKCLPGDFHASSSMVAAAFKQCVTKVQSGDVPAACADVPAMPQVYICFANSMGYLVDVDGVQSFDVTALENRALAYSSEEAWRQTIADRMSQCQDVALASLTPQQLAAYSYMCIEFSLFVDCDRQQDLRGELDMSALVQRDGFLARAAQMRPASMLDGVIADATWKVCREYLYLGEDVALRYAGRLSTLVCLLQDFVNDAGRLETDRLLTTIAEKSGGQFSVELQVLEDGCGPSAPGYENATAEEFVKCWIAEGSWVNVEYESNLVASAIPESCTISV